MILTPLQKLPKNVRDLGKLNVGKGFKKLPKGQKIAQSGHTGWVSRRKERKNFFLTDIRVERSGGQGATGWPIL